MRTRCIFRVRVFSPVRYCGWSTCQPPCLLRTEHVMPHNGKGTHPHGLREARSRGLVGDHEVKATAAQPWLDYVRYSDLGPLNSHEPANELRAEADPHCSRVSLITDLHVTKARLLLYDLPHATHEDDEVLLKRSCRQFVARQFF